MIEFLKLPIETELYCFEALVSFALGFMCFMRIRELKSNRIMWLATGRAISALFDFQIRNTQGEIKAMLEKEKKLVAKIAGLNEKREFLERKVEGSVQ